MQQEGSIEKAVASAVPAAAVDARQPMNLSGISSPPVCTDGGLSRAR